MCNVNVGSRALRFLVSRGVLVPGISDMSNRFLVSCDPFTGVARRELNLSHDGPLRGPGVVRRVECPKRIASTAIDYAACILVAHARGAAQGDRNSSTFIAQSTLAVRVRAVGLLLVNSRKVMSLTGRQLARVATATVCVRVPQPSNACSSQRGKNFS